MECPFRCSERTFRTTERAFRTLERTFRTTERRFLLDLKGIFLPIKQKLFLVSVDVGTRQLLKKRARPCRRTL